jgi:acylphosphatase
MQREAESRGLTGWVRNLPDGRVEAVVEGGTNQIEQLIVWCGQGPSGSRVSDVRVLEETPAGIEGFEITR